VEPSSIPQIGIKKQGLCAHPVVALTAPTTISPAPATEQKQHQENNQYGFHVGTSCVKGSWTGLCNGNLTSSLHNIIEVAKGNV
jgi:hypothetical protein